MRVLEDGLRVFGMPPGIEHDQPSAAAEDDGVAIGLASRFEPARDPGDAVGDRVGVADGRGGPPLIARRRVRR